MNRIVTTAAATIVGGFALLALTACNAGLDGAGVPAGATALVAQIQADRSLFSGTSNATGVAGSVHGFDTGSGSGAIATTKASPTSVASAATLNKVATTTSSKPPTGPGSGSGQGTGPRTRAGNGTGSGHGKVTSSTGSKTTAPTTSSGDDTSSTSGSNSGTGSGSAGSGAGQGSDSSTQQQVPAPKIKSASISCDYSDTDKTYHESLSYEVANATGMALSVDNPGIVGSYGTYDWHGTIEIPNLGCYAVNGEQTYTLYTVGGTGPQASKTITRTGTHFAITPPPFSQTTPDTSSTPIPTPSATSSSATSSATSN